MRSRSGFSFVEMLVALVIVGLMAAVISPALLPRMRDGEFTRFNQNVGTVKAATTVFLADVGAYPGRPTQFFQQPTGGTSKDLFNATISVGRATKWRGPYMDTDSLRFFAPETIGLGAAIVDSFTVKTSGGHPYATLILTGVTREDQLRYKKDYDSGAGVAAADSLTGLVRYNKDTLFVLFAVAR